MLYEPMVFYDAPEKAGISTGTAARGEPDNAKCQFDLSGLIKKQEEKIEINFPMGITPTFKEENSLKVQSQQRQFMAIETQPQMPNVFDVVDTPHAKPTPFDTAMKMASRIPFLTIGSKLYMYNGVFYAPIRNESVQRLIVDVCREDVVAVGSPSFVKSVYDMLLKLPELEQRGLEANQRVVSFQNGALLLDTGEFVLNSPMLFTTYGLRCNYLGGNPPSPCFDQFLWKITGGDVVLIERIWQMLGYILTPDLNGKSIFMLQGVQNSGKSVLSALLSSLFNEEAVLSLDVHDLSSRFAPSEFLGKALCISPDLPSEALDSRSVSKLKQLTGNDVISADVKNQNRVQFRNTAKIVMATNHPLIIRGDDKAFIGRIIVVPFNYSTPKDQQDWFLIDKLKAERDAIATKAMGAYYQLVRQKYQFSGNYSLNEFAGAYSMDSAGDHDTTSCIWAFAKSSFVKDEASEIFISDAHRMFSERYGCIPVGIFSLNFVSLTNQFYGATHIRKRKSGEKNPTSCVVGIKFTG